MGASCVLPSVASLTGRSVFYDFLTIMGVNKPILVWPAFPFSNYTKEKSSLKGEVMLKWGIESLA